MWDINDYDISLMLRYVNYSEVEPWRLGRNLMYYSAIGKLKSKYKCPKDLFELEDELNHGDIRASNEQQILFENLMKKLEREKNNKGKK